MYQESPDLRTGFNNTYIVSRCGNTIKAHNKRHLEIAEIIQAIHRLEGSSTKDSPLYNNKRKAKKRDDSDPNPSDDGNLHVGRVDHEREIEWDSNSSTLNNDEDDPKEGKQCWSGGMENADVRKAAKAERKAAKNQVLFEVITPQDLALVDKALHPESDQQASAAFKSQGLADNHTIDENIAFNANTFKWSKLRQTVHMKKIARNNGGKQKTNTPEQDNEILSPIFASLGISTHLSKANKQRKSLDAKLRAAILGDIVAFKNDQVETMQRMAGYWRYANKRTYNEMVRNNEIWDWATGEKLPEITEEAELDVIEEQNENPEAQAGTLDGETEGQIPEYWDDPDFEIPAGQTELTNGRSDRLTRQLAADRDMKLDEEVNLIRDSLSFKILSLDSSDDDWGRVRDESGDHANKGSEALNGSSTPRTPLSSVTPNLKGPHEEGFQGVKDTRVLGIAIRKASPPFKDTPSTPQSIRNLLPIPTKNRDTSDLLNRFGALNNETPAPCEEVKKVDPPLIKSVVKIPAKPIVKTLVIHDENDEWQTLHRLKGKKGAKAAGLREQAAVNVHAKNFAGGKSFAAAVKKGL